MSNLSDEEINKLISELPPEALTPAAAKIVEDIKKDVKVGEATAPSLESSEPDTSAVGPPSATPEAPAGPSATPEAPVGPPSATPEAPAGPSATPEAPAAPTATSDTSISGGTYKKRRNRRRQTNKRKRRHSKKRNQKRI